MDTGVILLLALGMIIYPILFYGFIDWQNSSDRIIGFSLLPAFIFSGGMLFYKKLQEKKLALIETGVDKGTNRKLVLKFLNSKSYQVVRNNRDFVIGVCENDGILWPKQITVLFEDDRIYVNVLTLNIKARVPSFFTAKSIIKTLNIFLSESVSAANKTFAQ